MKCVEVRREPRNEPGIRHLVGKINGTRETERVGSAVAFDGNALKAKKRSAIQAARSILAFSTLKPPRASTAPSFVTSELDIAPLR